jgi:signal transduction histidine kinase
LSPGDPAGIRVLLIDDDEDDFVLTRDLLGQCRGIRAELEWAPDSGTGLDLIRRGRHDAYLLDYLIDGRTGLDLLTALQGEEWIGPIIILTGQGDHDIDMAAMDRGACDYLTKDRLDSESLERSIRYAITQARTLRELRTTADALRETNRELEAFTYSVSHDLRAPLRAIDGYSHLLNESLSSQLDPESIRRLDLVRRNVHRMSGLIDDLLMLSRAGRAALRCAPISTHELAQRVTLAELDRWAGPPVELEIEPMPEAWADAGLLEQVYHNLVANALKYGAPDDPIRMRLGSTRLDDETVYFVEDNGIGFDMKDATRIFDPFLRLQGRGDIEGSGVGLSIVQRIVRRHGGRAWAESNPGQGARFCFTLAQHHESESEPTPEEDHERRERVVW